MRNVVLLCLDSVRKDTFDTRATRLSEAADLVYENCRTVSSWSAPSYTSMMTGTLPHRHGVHAHDPAVTVDRSETLLGDLDGYEARGVSTNVFAGSPYGFDRLFDQFVDVSETCRRPEGLDPAAYTASGSLGTIPRFVLDAVRGDATRDTLYNGTAGALDKLSKQLPVPKLFDDGANAVCREVRREVADAPEPFVFFATFMEAHTPLRHARGFDRSLHDASNRFSTDRYGVWELMGPERLSPADRQPFLETRRGLYEAAVEYLDRTLAPLVGWLQGATDRETTVVVTADHGENLGYPCEDGLVRHKSSLSEGLLHVPLLVINPPAGYPSVERRLVSHRSLRELVGALAAGEVTDVASDRAVAEHIGMSAGPDPPADRAHWDRLMRCAYDQRGLRKTVWDSQGGKRRFRIDPTNACWQEQLAGEPGVPEWADEWFELPAPASKRRAVREAGSTAVQPAVTRRLETLGYA